MDVNIALIGAIVILLLVIVFLAKAIKVVPEFQRLVVFRLGRLLGQKGPGPHPADPVRGQGDGRRPA